MDLRFVLTAYVVTIAMLVPASAWLSAWLGPKRLFIAAMIVFALGSFACALADGVATLVAARIVQGAGGAMMTPVGRAMLVALTPRAGLIRAMTLFTVPGLVAPLVGPPLAGLIVEQASWRWIFLINLPICAVSVAAVALLVPSIEEEGALRFDATGYALILVGMGLVAVLTDAAGWSMATLPSRAAFAVAVVAVALAYRRHARRTLQPILDPALLAVATLNVSLAAGLFQRMAVGALPFLLPMLLQNTLGMTPLAAGRIMIASAVGGLAARLLLPALLSAMTVRQAMIASAAASSLLTTLPACFGAGTPVWAMIALIAALGMIRAGFFVPITAIAYTDLPARAVGQATVLFTMVQQFSLGLGVSVAAALLEAGGGAAHPLAPGAFALPFVGLAALGALAIPLLYRLPPTVAHDMRHG